jgi:protein O-mannosyl-transferase
MNVNRTRLVGVAMVIFAGTIWLHWPSVHGKFLGADDTEYLRQSVKRNGLTWNAVKWAFTTTAPYYQPLPRLSHVLDYQIWGKNAAGHHATSVLLHALNAVLVFGFLWTLLGATSLTIGERLAMAVGVTLVFASHPLQAESVAWMSGRTQLLCTTFGIGSLWAYVAGAPRRMVCGLYVLALLSKPMAVSLPFVMLVIDYFPLKRHERLSWGRLLRGKALLIGLGAVTVAAAMITESQKGGLMIPFEKIPLPQRVVLMAQSLMFYPWKLMWPEHLSPYYPLQLGPSLNQWPALAPVLCVGMITGLVIWAWRRLPALAAGWGAYVILVLPVSGLMPAGLHSVALRHAYVAILPLLLVAGGATVWMWRHSMTIARVALVGSFVCVLWVFGLCTRNLIPVWHDDETLWRTPVKEFPDSELANRMLASALLAGGRANEALEYAQRAFEIAPEQCYSHMVLGSVLGRLGHLQEAITHYRRALRINPDVAEAHYNLGNALYQTGKSEEAIEQYQQALQINPEYAEAHYNLGNVLYGIGKSEEAIEHYQQALSIDPDLAQAHYNLGLALGQTERITEAIEHLERAVRINPEYAEAHYYLGIILGQTGRMTESIEHLKKTLRIKPNFAGAQYNLGVALEKAGRASEAAEHYKQALRLQPDLVIARNALARLQSNQ